VNNAQETFIPRQQTTLFAWPNFNYLRGGTSSQSKFKKHIILHFNGLIHFDTCLVFGVKPGGQRETGRGSTITTTLGIPTPFGPIQNPASSKYFRAAFLPHLTN